MNNNNNMKWDPSYVYVGSDLAYSDGNDNNDGWQ